MQLKNRFISIFITLLIATVSGIAQENWPQWRGPDQNGISTSQDLPLTWGPSQNILWKVSLPAWGAATPIIWGGRIFITSPSKAEAKAKPAASVTPQSEQGRQRRRRSSRDPGGPELLLLCYAKADGKLLWQQILDNKNQLHRKQNDATPSPVTDGQHVWVVTGTGKVAAFDMQGRPVWKKDLTQEFGAFGHNWGYASSPLLHEGRLYIEVLHGYKTDDPSYIIALQAATGKLLWRQERPTDAQKESPDAYTTPVLLQHNGLTQIIISGADYVTGHDPLNGREIWRAGGLNPLSRPNYRIVGTPVIADGVIYAPTRKKPLLALKAGGKGDITSSHLLWKWEGPGAPDVPSPLCDGKYFYMVDDGGIATCLDAKTGAVIWGPERTHEGIVDASPILAHDRIYVLNENAITTVIAAGPEYRKLATNELDGTYTLASPAVSGSRLFIRTAAHLYCIAAEL